jgi:major membrane immunogen (membrane-anchored lipoprotein)
MKKFGATAALLACALLAACGREDDGSPTAAENEQLNNISEVLDTSADSLVAEDPALGNGEAGAQTGELPVGGDEAANDLAANGM